LQFPVLQVALKLGLIWENQWIDSSCGY